MVEFPVAVGEGKLAPRFISLLKGIRKNGKV
jgi:hypothetical protein